MDTKTIKKFSYTAKDIEALIQADIHSKLGSMLQLNVGKIHFHVEMMEDPTDWRAEFPLTPTFTGAGVEVEV